MKSNITLINDDKFKSIFISVNFLRELKKEDSKLELNEKTEV